ncbi:division/cell wall cluster transcriptional repressor MraZ [candidate division GN15 bacterium]|nr:division/cell wall cluster transcriptional repressor MraZ [candidate division GN15 bacterium]
MTGFFGQYTTTMDSKGRCILPAKLRGVTDDDGNPLLEGEIFLTKGLEGCLSVYPASEWAAIQQRLSKLDFTDKAYRSFSRRFYSYASPVTPDKTGRILIPQHLITEANLEKELVVIGVNRLVEIWSPRLLKYYLEQYAGSYEEEAAKLFTGDSRGNE